MKMQFPESVKILGAIKSKKPVAGGLQLVIHSAYTKKGTEVKNKTDPKMEPLFRLAQESQI